jgi:hypothetical protein
MSLCSMQCSILENSAVVVSRNCTLRQLQMRHAPAPWLTPRPVRSLCALLCALLAALSLSAARAQDACGPPFVELVMTVSNDSPAPPSVKRLRQRYQQLHPVSQEHGGGDKPMLLIGSLASFSPESNPTQSFPALLALASPLDACSPSIELLVPQQQHPSADVDRARNARPLVLVQRGNCSFLDKVGHWCCVSESAHAPPTSCGNAAASTSLMPARTVKSVADMPRASID